MLKRSGALSLLAVSLRTLRTPLLHVLSSLAGLRLAPNFTAQITLARNPEIVLATIPWSAPCAGYKPAGLGCCGPCWRARSPQAWRSMCGLGLQAKTHFDPGALDHAGDA